MTDKPVIQLDGRHSEEPIQVSPPDSPIRQRQSFVPRGSYLMSPAPRGSILSNDSRRSVEPKPVAMVTESVWTRFNRMIGTTGLLFMAASNFNLLGFFYLLLFILHSYAYYALKVIDHPIDYVLGAGELGLRANIRFFFSSCFMFVSIGLLFIVVALKVSLHLSGEDLNPFDLTTDAKSSMFVFFARLIPNFDSVLTLVSVFTSVIIAIIFNLTLDWEDQEHKRRQEKFKREFSHYQSLIENGPNMWISVHAQVSEVLKDYVFHQRFIYILTFTLNGVIAATQVTTLNSFYVVIFLFQGLCVALSLDSLQRRTSPLLNKLLIGILTLEITFQYAFFISHLPGNSGIKQNFAREIFGLLLNKPSFVNFGLKILLLTAELYRYKFSVHLTSIQTAEPLKSLVQMAVNQQSSALNTLVVPASHFCFCALSIVFLLLHPSAIYAPFLPLLMVAFFVHPQTTRNFFSIVSTFFISVTTVYLAAYYFYQLYNLTVEDSLLAKWANANIDPKTAYLIEVFGMRKNSMAMRQFFPTSAEFLLYLLIVAFLALSTPVVEEEPAMAFAIRDSFLPRDSDISQAEISTANAHTLKRESRKTRTLREKVMRRMRRLYRFLLSTFQSMTNLITIHTTKFALLVLFFVTAFRPNIMNAVLFVMFLLLAMSNNSQMLAYWKLTLSFVCAMITGQYYIRIFTSAATMERLKQAKTSKFCLSGLVSCQNLSSDAELSLLFGNTEIQNFKLYMPYVMLLLTFIIAYIILMSKNYQTLMDYYIEQELKFIQEQKKLPSLHSSATEKSSISSLPTPRDTVNATRKSVLAPVKENESQEEASQVQMDIDDDNQQIREDLKDQVFMVDPLTRLFVKNALYMLLATMALVISTLPVSLTNVILLGFMSVIVYKALIYKSQVDLYRKSWLLLQTLNIVTFIAIVFRYWVQFLKVVEDQKNPLQELQQGSGVDIFEFRLLSLTVILVITRIQLLTVHNQALSEILNEAEQDVKKTRKLTWFDKVLHTVAYGLYYLLPSFIIGMIFLYSVLRPSLLGFVGLVISLIVLKVYEETFWKENYAVIGITTQVIIVVTYIVNSSVYIIANYFKEVDLNPRYNFILNAALQNVEIVQEDKTFFMSCLWMFSIIAICLVSKALQDRASMFVCSDNDQDQTELNLRLSYDSNNEEGIRRKYAKAVYDFDEPIRNCEIIKHAWCNFVFSHGLTMTQVLLVAVMLVKLDVNSLVFLYYFFRLYRVEYHPSRFASKMNNPEMKEKQARISSILNGLIFWSTFLIIYEYLVFVFNNFKSNTEGSADNKAEWLILWENFVKNRLCYADERPESQGMDCVNDWSDWISFAVGTGLVHDLMFKLLLLYSSYLTRYYAAHDTETAKIQLLDEPVCGDKNDVTKMSPADDDNASTLTIMSKILDDIAFEFFPYILIMAMFVSLTYFNTKTFSDVIAMGYLIHSIYFVANFRTFYTKNFTMLQSLRKYNLLVLTLYISFQMPLFLCPGIPEDFDQSQYFYVPVKQCTNLSSYRDMNNQESWHSFYFVMTRSIGLRKFEAASYPLSFLVIILICEVQSWAFSHPYFQVYVLKNLQQEKLDSKMRGFMQVEKFHLHRKWAYKSIRAQIAVLHNRLMRITKEYFLLIESYGTSNQPEPIQESTLLIDKDNGLRPAPLAEDSQLISEDDSTKRIRQIDELMNSHFMQEMLENIATDLLQHPKVPVVSLKKLTYAVREELLQRQQMNLADLDDVKQVVLSLVSQAKLQREEYKKNRLDLYYKERIGLNFAIKRGCENYLDQGDYNFYYNLFRPQYELSERKSNEASEKSSFTMTSQTDEASSLANFKVMQIESFPQENSDHFFDFYTELQEINQSQEKVGDKETPLSQKINLMFRGFLLECCGNRLMFYSLYNSKGILMNEGSFQKVPIRTLIQAALFSQVENICFIMMFLNFAYNANMISLVLPVSALFYALLENPKPNNKYWYCVTLYLVCIIALKFFYQLPLICSSPEFAVWSCNEVEIQREVLVRRIDYIIGFEKYNGGASYPRDAGIFKGIVFDIVLLIMLVYLKTYLVKTGQWHYVRTDDDIHVTPKFKSFIRDRTDQEKYEHEMTKDFLRNEYREYGFGARAQYNARNLISKLQNFVIKLLPRFMDKNQQNLDLRTQEDTPTIPFKYNKVKPGQDYFSGNFFTLLVLFIYTLLFYRSITGQVTMDKIESVALLDNFSSSQVLLLFLFMTLMMIERMLYRTRTNQSLQNMGGNDAWITNEWAQHTLTMKLMIYVTLVLFVHIQCGFYFPIKQGIKLNNNLSLLFYYMLWVLHLVYASLQIKHGYPQQPYKHAFMRDTSFTTVLKFRVYRAVPFLWEMKVIIDWTVTNTCLDLFQWFRLDDAFNYVYYNKYQSDDRRSRPEFEPRDFFEKFTQGFCFAFSLICLILAPVLLFSGINPIKMENPVKQGHISMMFELNESGNEYQIFTAQAFNIRALLDEEKDEFKKFFIPNDPEMKLDQLQRLQFTPYSESNWLISSPSLKKLAHDFEIFSKEQNAIVKLTSTWDFIREFPTNNERAKGSHVAEFALADFRPFIDLILSPKDSDETKATVRIQDVFPKMLRLGQFEKTANLEVYSKEPAFSDQNFQTAIDLTLFKPKDGQMYWTFSMPDADPTSLFQEQDQSIEYETEETTDEVKQDLVIIVFNEEVLSSFLQGAMSLSVIGIYVTIVYAVGNFLRIIFDRYSERVIYEELPNTERLFEICEGIFIAQLEGDMKTEKKLYDLLIMVYRSPELMIKMTGSRLRHDDEEPRRIVQPAGSQLNQI